LPVLVALAVLVGLVTTLLLSGRIAALPLLLARLMLAALLLARLIALLLLARALVRILLVRIIHQPTPQRISGGRTLPHSTSGNEESCPLGRTNYVDLTIA